MEIQKYLSGIQYPVKKQNILDHAKQAGANEMIMGALDKLPDKEYSLPIDVSAEIGKLTGKFM